MICAILLAAGLSSRMKENKLLALLNGKGLIRHAAENLIASGIDRLIIITGHEAEKVEDTLSGLPVTFTHHAGFAEGMGTSLAAGINALPETCTHALVALGDMPALDPAALKNLLDLPALAADYEIYAPVFQGRRGHPVIFRNTLFAQLKQIKGDKGAKHILNHRNNKILLCPWENASCHQDVDDAETLLTLQRGESRR